MSMNLTGTVLSLPDARGNVTVQMGILRSKAHISDLEIIEEPVSYTAKNLKHTNKGKLKMKQIPVGPSRDQSSRQDSRRSGYGTGQILR